MCFSFSSMSHLFLCLFLTVAPERGQEISRLNKVQDCGQSPLDEVEPHEDDNLETDTSPPWHDNHGGTGEEKMEVSELAPSTLWSKGKNKKKKNQKLAASSWDIPVLEEAPVLKDEAPALEEACSPVEHVTHDMSWKLPQYVTWNFGATRDVPTEPDTAAGEAINAEETSFAAPEENSHIDEPYNIVPEVISIPEDTFPGQEAVSNEKLEEMERAAANATPEASQAELIIKDSDDSEKHTLDQHDNISQDLNDPCESTSGPDVAPMHSAPPENPEFLVPPPRPALSAVRDERDFRPPLPSAPSSTVTSALEAAAPEAPTEDSHTITLKILNGSKALRSIVFIEACTRTAILKEARAYCVKCAQDDQSLKTLLAKGYDLALMSLKMYGYDMDLSTYKVENLSSLVGAIEKTGIPRFTLRISAV